MFSLVSKEKIFTCGLCVLIMFAPLVAPTNWYWGKYLCLSGALVLVLLAPPSKVSSFRGLPLIFVAFAFVAGVQILPFEVKLWGYAESETLGFSVDPAATFEIGLFCAVLALFGASLREQNASSRALSRMVFYSVLCSGVVQAFYGVLMELTSLGLGAGLQQKTAYVGSATGTLVNRSVFGLYMNLSIVACVCLMATYKVKESLILLVTLRLSLLLLTVGLTMSHSRAAAAGFVLLSIMLIIKYLFQKPRTKHKVQLPQKIAVVMTFLLVDVLIVSNWFGLEKLSNRIVNTSIKTEVRDDIAANALSGFNAQSKWLGIGLGGASDYIPSVKSGYFSGSYNRLHNDLLELYISVGALGAMALAIIVCIAIRSLLSTVIFLIPVVPHLVLDFVATQWVILFVLTCLISANGPHVSPRENKN